MAAEERARSLAGAVAARRDALVALTQDLVRIPSRNPPGAAYRPVCELIARRLAPVARAVAGAIRRTLGREPTFVVSPGAHDQKHIDRIGRLKGCIAYGPGRLDLAHQADEWVGIDDMAASATVTAQALDALLPG